MPKGHDSAHITLPSGDEITLDYTYHRYTEHHPYGSTTAAEHFIDWDITALYLNGELVPQALISALDPDWAERFDTIIREAH